MNKQSDLILLQIIAGFLGSPKNYNGTLVRDQWQYNCPSMKCRNDNKYNLEYNSKTKVFKCWKCKYRGFIYRLAEDYGESTDSSNILAILPKGSMDYTKKKTVRKLNHHLVTCSLPEDYRPLSIRSDSRYYKMALDYVMNTRKISRKIIEKHEIGYTENGKNKFRIILPSRNSLGQTNYFEARSFLKNAKIPYMKPPHSVVHKNDIIYNESNINWDLPIFLVEGVFDMIRVPNPIPVLGKEMSDLLVLLLCKHKCKVIFCYDPDAHSTMTEAYRILESLGLDVYFVDLRKYNRDISKIAEDFGQQEVMKAISNIKKLDLITQVSNEMSDN